MLGKLIKYEFKATARFFVPLLIALLVVSVINRICFSFDGSMDFLGPDWSWLPSAISMFLYVAIIITIFVLTLVLAIKRFHSSLLTDEGYLMMTLPASVDSHIWSKAVTAGVWIIAGIAVSVASVFVMAMTGDIWGEFLNEVTYGINQMTAVLGGNLWVFAVLWLVILVLDLLSQLMIVYMCISIGHQIPKHQVLSSIGAYLAYVVISQIVVAIAAKIAEFCGFFEWFSNLQGLTMGYLTTFGFLGLVVLVLAITYFVTRYLLKNKLNLE
ncbi:MAG: hypothetical protein ACOX7J_06105 [Bacillota bacterium]|jgi:hypothetical protein